jgi:thioredoxin-like negative regulator of GroEL
MMIRLNRFTAILLMVLLYPLVLVSRLVRFLTGQRKPVYLGTIEGDPLAYSGEKPLLIAVWAEGAAVWTAATAEVVEQLKAEFAGRCEFAYVEAASRQVTEAYQAEVVPVLILRHHGKEIGRFVNTLGAEAVEAAIVAAIA